MTTTMQILLALAGMAATIILTIGAFWFYVVPNDEADTKPKPEPDMDGLAVSHHERLAQQHEDNLYDYE